MKHNKDIGDKNRATISICENIRAILYSYVDKVINVVINTMRLTKLYIKKQITAFFFLRVRYVWMLKAKINTLAINDNKVKKLMFSSNIIKY